MRNKGILKSVSNKTAKSDVLNRFLDGFRPFLIDETENDNKQYALLFDAENLTNDWQ